MLSQTNKPIDAYIDLKAVKKMYNISYIYMYYIIKTHWTLDLKTVYNVVKNKDLLITAYYSLLTTYYLLLTAHYSLTWI